MNKKYLGLFFIILFAFLLIYPVHSGENIQIKVIQVSGKAKVLEKNLFTNIFKNSFWKELQPGDKLDNGDKIKTLADSSLEISFSDDTFAKIGEKSRVVIEENKIKESGQFTSIKLQKGKIWSRIKGSWNRLTSFEVITPSAIAGVKGTIFSVETDGEKSILDVKEGEVEFVVREKKEKKVTITAGESSKIINNRITKPQKENSPGKSNWDDEKIKKWLERTDMSNKTNSKAEIKNENNENTSNINKSENNKNDNSSNSNDKKSQNNESKKGKSPVNNPKN